MLAWTIYISFLGVAALICLPAANARAARSMPRGIFDFMKPLNQTSGTLN
jgi:hypothetical protein